MRLRFIGYSAALLVLLGGCGTSAQSGSDTPDSTATLPPLITTDVSVPSISISQPATGAVYSSPVSSITLAGVAADDVGLAQVSWSNSLGGSGSQALSGISVNWNFTVALLAGDNIVTVTARDAAGNSHNAVMTIAYAAPSEQASINGYVDSSLINRNGVSAVYVYAGAVTPDDLGGTGATPYSVITVTQVAGTCRFYYQTESLPAGLFTIAFTNQAANDNPSSNDAITFIGTSTVTLRSSVTSAYDFVAPKILKVGPGKTYAKPSAAAADAVNGDVIEIDAGEYLNDSVIWRQNNLTLRGVGGRAYLHATDIIPYTPGNDQENGMGIWVTRGINTVVENVEFSGAAVPHANGAGIRADGSGLTVCNSYFHNNENGILGGGGEVLIEYSEFAHNGMGDGYTHNIYIGGGTTRFTLRYSYSHHANIGHNVKSRAQENYILYNRIMDEVTGNSSYDVDLPDGGLSYIIGNLIQQGTATDNPTAVSYAAESASNPKQELYVVNNTIVNDLGHGAFIYTRSGTTAKIVNNIFTGNGTVLNGPGTFTTNLISNSAGLMNVTGFDYRLTSASPARDAGSDPGSANGFSLAPVSQYLHKTSKEARNPAGNIDIGAYEYSP